jgi:NTP pyrophosphatase (non-canonical NTP hydrolase)
MNELTVGRIEFAPRSFGIMPAAVEGDTSPRWSKAAANENNAHFTNLRAANISRQQEWDTGNQLTLSYRGNELAGETGEACNVIKKLERERLGIAGSRDTKEHLAEELADVIICVDLIAMAEGIDMDAAVRAKFNATSEKVGLRTRLVAA